MKFAGFEIKNYRSIGKEPIIIHPIYKLNILVGQNNVGKSNVIKCINEISHWSQGKELNFSVLDLHNRKSEIPISIKLYYKYADNEEDNKLKTIIGDSEIWFELNWIPGQPLRIVNDYFVNIEDFRVANPLIEYFTQRSWPSPVDKRTIKSEFQNSSNSIFENRFKRLIPESFIIPEFRKIREGENYQVDGENLIKLLANFRTPKIGHDQDKTKFEKIVKFSRQLLNLPNINLVIPPEEKEIIIENEELRLPLNYYGTGVHELIILLSAFITTENKLCCIEEPEIHLNPRLQNDLIQFLIKETSNIYLISSHSPTIINSAYYEQNAQVIFIRKENGETTFKVITNAKDSLDAMRDLGYKPNDLLQSNCILWVEGVSDEIYINKWINLLAPELINGQDYVFLHYSHFSNIEIEEYGNSSELINLIEINHNAIYITDSDKEKNEDSIEPRKEKLKTKCEEQGGIGWITEGREIENYLPIDVLEKFLKQVRNCEIHENLGMYEDINEFFDRQTKKGGTKSLNYDKCKKNYAKKIIEYFSIENITGDLKTRLDEIIEKIRKWKE